LRTKEGIFLCAPRKEFLGVLMAKRARGAEDDRVQISPAGLSQAAVLALDGAPPLAPLCETNVWYSDCEYEIQGPTRNLRFSGLAYFAMVRDWDTLDTALASGQFILNQKVRLRIVEQLLFWNQSSPLLLKFMHGIPFAKIMEWISASESLQAPSTTFLELLLEMAKNYRIPMETLNSPLDLKGSSFPNWINAFASFVASSEPQDPALRAAKALCHTLAYLGVNLVALHVHENVHEALGDFIDEAQRAKSTMLRLYQLALRPILPADITKLVYSFTGYMPKSLTS
jgi:hypothetical protein